MKHFFRGQRLAVMFVLLGMLCATTVSVNAATTIGPNIITDGTLFVSGSTTLTSLTVGPGSSYASAVNSIDVVDNPGNYSTTIESDQTANPTLGSNALYVAGRALHNAGVNLNAVGINSDGTNEGLGTTDVVNGGYFTASNFGAGHSNHLWGLETFTDLTAGTADESVGLLVDTNSGLTTNNYGIVVQDQTSGTNNYAIKTGLGKVQFGDISVLPVAFQSWAPGFGYLASSVNFASASGGVGQSVSAAATAPGQSVDGILGLAWGGGSGSISNEFDTIAGNGDEAAAITAVASNQSGKVAASLTGLQINPISDTSSGNNIGLWVQDISNGGTGNYAIKTGLGKVEFGDIVQSVAAAFASLPACSGSTEGAMRAVNNSTTNTWGATITGGGANHVMAYCDGTNWTVMAK